jgi:hypothetical protein
MTCGGYNLRRLVQWIDGPQDAVCTDGKGGGRGGSDTVLRLGRLGGCARGRQQENRYRRCWVHQFLHSLVYYNDFLESTSL